MQADLIPTPRDVLLCPFTSTLVSAPLYRLNIEPDGQNGLAGSSQMMVDKTGPVRWDRIDRVIGRLAPLDMARLEGALAGLLGLAD